ncbi:MAG: Tol-Pal system beta propeller repeat protein TolB [Proteobacteria bacterium]|nr:Tol-Pal system beta propeller repeat protein TolB [Pseudomonadota bacterium]MBU1686448.1 Tol-Pal system beta propeller repeat protein TolB [Pseudomonadota bacterium]
MKNKLVLLPRQIRRFVVALPLGLVILFCFPSLVAARIVIDITSAELRKVPMAVPYFVDKDNPDEMTIIGKEMAATLTKSLVFHGFITVISPETYGGGQKNDWRELDLDFTVLGNFKVEGDEMTVECRLVDNSSGGMILGRRYRGRVEKQREMILKYCDEVINTITGEPGISRTRIAFVSDKSGLKEIYLTDIFGDELRQVTNHKKLAVSPRFSPDGRLLSYTSYHRGNPNLYVTDLTQGKTTTAISRRQGLNMAPDWSPDGKTLAVTLSPDGNPDLYLINTKGDIIDRLTNKEGLNVSPSWSPDGSRLAFVSDRSGTPQIYIMELKNKTVRRITYLGNYNSTPSWSPQGDLIAYSGNYENMYHIYVISPEGGRPTRLTKFWGDHESPSWSPDGRQIVFSRKRKDDQQICAIFRNGEGFRILFDWDGQESFPQWSPRLEE